MMSMRQFFGQLTVIMLAMIIGIMAIIPQLSFAAEPLSIQLPSQEQTKQYERLTAQLRCLVCQNQTIADSNADIAADLRNKVKQLILQEHSDDEILDYLTTKYGDFVRYQPVIDARTILLWGFPLLALLMIVGLCVAIQRKNHPGPA